MLRRLHPVALGQPLLAVQRGRRPGAAKAVLKSRLCWSEIVRSARRWLRVDCCDSVATIPIGNSGSSSILPTTSAKCRHPVNCPDSVWTIASSDYSVADRGMRGTLGLLGQGCEKAAEVAPRQFARQCRAFLGYGHSTSRTIRPIVSPVARRCQRLDTARLLASSEDGEQTWLLVHISAAETGIPSELTSPSPPAVRTPSRPQARPSGVGGLVGCPRRSPAARSLQ
jgi:hypothetical protein